MLLIVLGFLLIMVANTFTYTILKVSLDRVIAEVGALILVVGVLQSVFELRLRGVMLNEIASATLENQRIHDLGISDCLMNSRTVNDTAHWKQADNLTVGIQYSPKFFEDFHAVLKSRCASGKPTTVLALRPECDAAKFLRNTRTGVASISPALERIQELLNEASAETGHQIRLLTHDRVLRYSFIRTEENIWIKFYTNSPGRATVPAIKFRSDTPLYDFIRVDIDRLIEAAQQ